MNTSSPKINKLYIAELLKKWELRSLDLMKRHAHSSDIFIEDFQPSFPVIGHWMTMATINSESFKINFKLFFTTEQGIPFCKDLFNIPVENLTNNQLTDFAKELCNLVVGRIKYDFEKSQVHCSTSLPMSLRSFDNLFFVPSTYAESYEMYWKYRMGQSEIICRLELGIIDSAAFNQLNIDVETEVKSGAFELI